jgi:hypothetical protein
VKTWHLAVCESCEPIIPQPFETAEEADVWAEAHRATGHVVTRETQPTLPGVNPYAAWLTSREGRGPT